MQPCNVIVQWDGEQPVSATCWSSWYCCVAVCVAWRAIDRTHSQTVMCAKSFPQIWLAVPWWLTFILDGHARWFFVTCLIVSCHLFSFWFTSRGQSYHSDHCRDLSLHWPAWDKFAVFYCFAVPFSIFTVTTAQYSFTVQLVAGWVGPSTCVFPQWSILLESVILFRITWKGQSHLVEQ